MWKYNQPTEELIEQPTMEEPLLREDGIYDYPHGWDLEQFRKDKEEYDEHIASLRRLTISGPHSWKHEQDVPEKEFETEIFCKETGKRCESIICNTECAYHIAIPIPKVETVEDWLYDYKFLKDLTYKINQSEYGEGLSMEQTESVLLAIDYPKQQQSGERMFTLKEALQIWEHAKHGESAKEGVTISLHQWLDPMPYFKTKFNIDIPPKQ